MGSYRPQTHSRMLREFFFWSGIVATFAYRIIVVLNNYSKFWAQLSWYIGTVGFVIYFLHRYDISEKRAKLVKEYQLADKVAASDDFSQEEKDVMRYIFTTLKTTKEKWNYIFIFVMSAVAFVIGIYLDFLR